MRVAISVRRETRLAKNTLIRAVVDPADRRAREVRGVTWPCACTRTHVDKHARVRFSLLGVEWSAQKAGEIRDFLGCSSEITVEGRYLDPRSR